MKDKALTCRPDLIARHESRIQLLESRVRQLGLCGTGMHNNSKAVIVNGKPYRNASEAGAVTGVHEQAIRDACNGHRNIKGVSCRWADEAKGTARRQKLPSSKACRSR